MTHPPVSSSKELCLALIGGSARGRYSAGADSKRGKSSNCPPQDKCVDIVRALIGVDRFKVHRMPHDVVLLGNPIAAMHVTRLPREDAVGHMVRLIRAGLIDLTQFDLAEFALEDANDAVMYAAANAGPLRLAVLRPDRRNVAG